MAVFGPNLDALELSFSIHFVSAACKALLRIIYIQTLIVVVRNMAIFVICFDKMITKVTQCFSKLCQKI